MIATMPIFRDPRLEAEFPSWGGLHPQAAPAVFQDLTTYLQQSLEQIAARYWVYRTTEDLAAQARVAQATDAATVDAYYAVTTHYLYELSYWEASREKQGWFRVLTLAARTYGLNRILDFGGGVGGLSLFLSACGVQCGHLDVPGRTSEYAAWRFARHERSIAIHDATRTATLPHSTYDAVVAWDVLEHMFDLDEALRSVTTLLRPGGWFLSNSTFADAGGNHLHIHLAKHATYADVREFNQLLARHRSQYQGQLKPNRLSRLLRACGMPHAVAGIRLAPRLKHGGNFLAHVTHQDQVEPPISCT